jgi:hypothetical protein
VQESGGAGQHWFALVTPAREYLFRTTSEEEVDGWVAAIAAEIAAAREQRFAISEEMVAKAPPTAVQQGTPSTAATLDLGQLEIS